MAIDSRLYKIEDIQDYASLIVLGDSVVITMVADYCRWQAVGVKMQTYWLGGTRQSNTGRDQQLLFNL